MTVPAPAQTWRPSALGKHVTKSRDWRVSLTCPELTITVDGEPVTRHIGSFGGLTVTPGRVWAHLELEHPDRRFRFRGIPNRRAASLATAFAAAQAEAAHALKLRQLIEEFDQAANQVRLFTEALATAVAVQLKTPGWLTTEFSAYWAARKAAVGFGQLLDDPDLQPHIADLSAVAKETVKIWRDDLPAFIAAQNERHLAVELDERHDFFDTVEKSPLTPEQARAVICFDNRMLVVASAGPARPRPWSPKPATRCTAT